MDTLLHAGLANAVLATALALAAWGVGRVTHRHALTHALWLLVLLKLVTPPLLTIRMPGLAATQAVSTATRADLAADESAENPDLALAEESGSKDAAAWPGLESSKAPVPPGIQEAKPKLPKTPAPIRRLNRAWSALPWNSFWKPAVAAVWLAGALLFWSIAAFRISWLRQLLRGAQPASAELQARVRELADRLAVAQCPKVWLVPVAVPPMLWAVLGTPRLLLPVALWDRLSAEQRDTLLAHELVHLRGRDHWVRRLELITLGLYWWHPVAWWARRELREAEEQRCDAGVVGALPASAAAYAQTLLDTVAFLSRARCVAPVGASSMGQVRVMKRRLNMILQGTKSRTWSRTSSWVSLALGAMLLPLMPTWAQPQRSQAQQPVRDDAEVRVSQARTQLIEVQLAPGQEAQDPGSRLQELEKKVDALRKEIEALRRELGAALAANRATKKSFERMFIDLQPWANQKLDETFHSQQYPGNNLASLPTGVQTLDGMTFKIGKQLIQLGTRIDKPAKVEGIKMDRKLSKLHILHATGYSVDDDTQIAEYTINYENGTSVTIPVVYGQDVLDWWKYSFSGEPTRGKVVWNGENEPAKKEFDATIRLYVTTWENPKPNLKIVSIDYAATGETQCVPFCVALTGEN